MNLLHRFGFRAQQARANEQDDRADLIEQRDALKNALREIVREWKPGTATQEWKTADDFAYFCYETAARALKIEP